MFAECHLGLCYVVIEELMRVALTHMLWVPAHTRVPGHHTRSTTTLQTDIDRAWV